MRKAARSQKPSRGVDRKILLKNARWALRETWTVSRRLVILLVIIAILEGAIAAGMVVAIGNLAGSIRHGLGRSGISGSSSWNWLLLVGCVLLGGLICTVVSQYCRQRLGERVRLEVSKRTMTHTLRLDLGNIEDQSSQDALFRALQNNGGEFVGFVLDALSALQIGAQAIGLAAVLVWIQPLTTVGLALLGVPLLGVRTWVARSSYEVQRLKTTKRRWNRYYLGKATQRQSFATVKIFGLGPLLVDRFDETFRDLMDEDQRLARRQAVGELLAGSLFTLGFLAVLGLVSYQALSSDLRFGALVTYVLGALRFRGTFDSLLGKISSMYERLLSIVNLREFFQLQSKIRGGALIPAARLRGRIEVSNLCFAYPGQSGRALDGITLAIEPGETVALVGPNGSGKTTLARLICQLYEPQSGQIRIDGIDIREYDLESLHRELAYVEQDTVRFEATAFENIACGDWKRLHNDVRRVESAAQLIGIHDRILSLPEGYQTQLGRMFGEHDFSGGQWQRLAMARAIARDCAIYVLDEPTSHMDLLSEYRVYSAIGNHLKDKTVILISHRFSSARLADRIFVLDEGRLVDQGSHDDLFARGGLYRELYRLHAASLDPSFGDRPGVEVQSR